MYIYTKLIYSNSINLRFVALCSETHNHGTLFVLVIAAICRGSDTSRICYAVDGKRNHVYYKSFHTTLMEEMRETNVFSFNPPETAETYSS